MLVAAACGSAAETASAPASAPGSVPLGTAIAAPPVDVPAVDKATIAEACQFGAAVFDVGPVALCAKAIELAAARLGVVHWPITSVTFRLQLCPPNARCAAPGDEPNEGWVIFTFTAGPPVMVHVGPSQLFGVVNGGLTAGDPEPVPGWLLAEIGSQS